METFQSWIEITQKLVNFPLLRLGGTSLTLGTLSYVILLLAILFYLTGKLRRWVEEWLLARRGVEIGVRQATGAIVRYFLIGIGFVVIVQTAGVDLSALTVLAGALGIGIGFGLQNITNNFVSGLIILFERPIKVGDRVEVGETAGIVSRISPRATTIVTNDNIAMIVPNSEFISSRVINWSYTNRDVRLNFPVGVSYGCDPELVKNALLEVAEEHPGLMKERRSDVLLREFGESSLNFVLRVWTREYATTPGVLRSDLNYAITRKFKEKGIEIPFPQRDLHIRSGALELKGPDPQLQGGDVP